MTWNLGTNGPFWTDERIEELKRLWALGWSASQISRELKAVSRSAIIGKVHRLGLDGRSATVIAEALKLGTRRLPMPSKGPAKPKLARPPKPPKPQKPPNWSIAGRGESKPPKPVQARVEHVPTLQIMGLHNHACRWPIGDPRGEGFGFCGRHKAHDEPYCQAHRELAYTARSERTPAQQKADLERRMKSIRRAA